VPEEELGQADTELGELGEGAGDLVGDEMKPSGARAEPDLTLVPDGTGAYRRRRRRPRSVGAAVPVAVATTPAAAATASAIQAAPPVGRTSDASASKPAA
jgi:hypothetical protein